MKVLQALGPPVTDREGQSLRNKLSLEAFMSEDGAPSAPGGHHWTALDAHRDARALVRLVQCPRCSKPFRAPVTLPCGHTHCQACLPPAHLRQNISYPNTADRQQGISCPKPGCSQEHSLADVNIDVTLSKVLT